MPGSGGRWRAARPWRGPARGAPTQRRAPARGLCLRFGIRGPSRGGGGPRRSLQWPSVISRSPSLSLSLLVGDHIGGYVRCTTLACRRLLHRLAQLDPDAVDVALDVRHAELAPHRRKQVGIRVLRARVDGRAGPPLAAARLKRLGGECLGQCLGGCLSARVARPLRRLPPPPGGLLLLLLLLLLPCARRAAVAVVLRAARWVAQQVVRL